MNRRRILSILIAIIVIPLTLARAEDKTFTIEDAYQSALGGNEAVKISEEGVLQSESRVDQAWTYVYPRLEAPVLIYPVQ